MDVSKTLVIIFLIVIFLSSPGVYAQKAYTIIDAKQYHQVFETSRHKIERLLSALAPYRQLSHNDQLQWIVQQLINTPYLHHGAMGEGDWQGRSKIYKPGGLHLQQDPVYRLDGLDCQTFVQISLALLYSKDLNSFDETILKIAYGAAGNPMGEIVHFYNRNHFVDGDLNPINQQNGFFADVTTHGELGRFTRSTSATITRLRWFVFKSQAPKGTVRVLDGMHGEEMVKHLNNYREEIKLPKFHAQKVTMSYLPKETLAVESSYNKFRPNNFVLNKIPTPAVVEMVYNHKNWSISGVNIKDIIGSELNVAHFGLLYRRTFQRGELIYHKISCDHLENGQRKCEVIPIFCQQQRCDELMLAHATAGYPRGFYWYKQTNGQYTCTAKMPDRGQPIQYCNRVEQRPLFEYLTERQYGSHWYMHNTAFLGLHIEKLL